jgi:hypothetical protein
MVTAGVGRDGIRDTGDASLDPRAHLGLTALEPGLRLGQGAGDDPAAAAAAETTSIGSAMSL